jgi:hypothetical protein
MRRILLVAVLAFVSGIPAEAQFVTLGEKVPPTSGCYKPFTYDQGVNLDIHVWSNMLKASDFQSLGVQPSDVPLEGFPGADAVLVQPEMERRRSPLVSIPPRGR